MQDECLRGLDLKCESMVVAEYEREHISTLLERKLERYSYLLSISGSVIRAIYT